MDPDEKNRVFTLMVSVSGYNLLRVQMKIQILVDLDMFYLIFA